MAIKKFYIAIFLVTGLAWNIAAQATEIFYGVRGSYGLYKEADLITIDPATGALASEIGPTGINGIGGLAVNPLDGSIYAASSGDGMGGLYTLDPLTGTATLVGDQGTWSSGNVWIGGLRVRDMGFDSSGTLFAITAKLGTGTEGKLVTIDLATGAITYIGDDPNTTTTFEHRLGMAFDSSGTLYIKETEKSRDEFGNVVFGDPYLHTVDSLSAEILSSVMLQTYDDDMILRNSLAFDALGTLYSHEWCCTDARSRVVTINPTDGTVTRLAETVPSNDDNLPGAAIGALVFAPVPEPGTLGLMGLGLAGIGFARKKTPK